MRLGLGLGVKNSGFVGGYDSATSAFLAATGITSKTESDAVNSLVLNLKSYGLWGKMKAIYPIVSDTFNLFSYTEDFANGIWSKVSCTITSDQTTAPNGTLTADLVTTTSTAAENRVRYTYVSAGMNLTQTTSVYVKKGTGRWFRIRNIFVASLNGNAWFDLDNGVVGTVNDGQTATIKNVGNGWYRCTLTGYKGVTTYDYVDFGFTDSDGSTYPSVNVNGYIWGAQFEVSATASTYQPITTTIANRFVSQFKYNLKDPRDLDAAFRLAFSGTWTYSKQGATPNGANAFANTYVNPTTLGFTQTDTHISAYLRTDSNGAKVDIGGSYNLFMGVRWANNYNYPINRSNNANGTSANSIGYFLASRVDNVRDRMYKNGTNVTNFTGAAVSLDNNTIMISATNGGGLYSDRQTAFNTIGNGLTDTEISNLYSSIQTFQTALARQV